MGSYIPNTDTQRREMLRTIGIDSVDALYANVPGDMLVGDDLKLPAGLSELEVRRAVTAMADKNRIYPPFCGAPVPTATSFPLW